MKQHEISATDLTYQDLKRVASAHSALESWSRRVLSTTSHIDTVIRLLRHNKDQATNYQEWIALLEDFEYIRTSIGEHAVALEKVASLVYSNIQLAETRRAFKEAKNISRLTIMAMFFVPLSYVSSLFSMNGTFEPGGSKFWVYFAVALPVLLCVFILGRGSSWGFIKGTQR
jgi:Mg2+ and Co2+ transporter CorA